MSRNTNFTLSEVVNQLGLTDDLSADDDNSTSDQEELIPIEDDVIPVDEANDTEEFANIILDDEGDVDIFEERDDSDTDDDDDFEESVSVEVEDSDESEIDDRTYDYISSKSGISYTTQEIPNRRRRRNILTQRPRVIANPQSESESFEQMLTEEIMRTVLRNTNRKVRELRRTLFKPSNYHNFSMEEFRSALAIILRAGSDRNNFTELLSLWKVGDSKPFYRAVMSFNCFKCFLRSIRFDNWHLIISNKKISLTYLISIPFR